MRDRTKYGRLKRLLTSLSGGETSINESDDRVYEYLNEDVDVTDVWARDHMM